MKQNKRCTEILHTVIDSLEEVRMDASELNVLEESKLAEQAATRIFYYLERIKEEMISLSKQHGNEELANYIKHSMEDNPDYGQAIV